MSNYDNIPHEMRTIKQWCVWRTETRNDKPTKVPYVDLVGNGQGLKASANSVTNWSYDQAVAVAHLWDGIGFFFHDTDDFVGLDFDAKDGQLTDEQISIVNTIGSYTEYSPSGKGVHVIVKGLLPGAVKGDVIEMYDHDRFFTMTGNVIPEVGNEIKPRQQHVKELYDMYKRFRPLPADLGDFAIPTREDSAVIDMMCRSDRIASIYNGSVVGDPSADYFAMLCSCAKFTTDSAQALRIMIGSPFASLIHANYKGGRVGKIEYHFDHEWNEAAYAAQSEALEDSRKLFGNWDSEPLAPHIFDEMTTAVRAVSETLRNSFTERAYEEVKENVKAVEAEIEQHVSQAVTTNNTDVFGSDWLDITAPIAPVTYPPFEQVSPVGKPRGLLGALIDYAYRSSGQHIAQTAIVSGLSAMCGIGGHAYMTSTGGGLNLYIVLLAMSGYGKEEVNRSVSTFRGWLTDNMGNDHEAKQAYLPKMKPSSAQGLHNMFVPANKPKDAPPDWAPPIVAKSQCVPFAEFAKTMRAVTAGTRDTRFIELNQALLTFYMASGRGGTLDGAALAKREDWRQSVDRPVLSLRGDATPDDFYSCLTETSINDGTISRMLPIEYQGEWPLRDEQAWRAAIDDKWVKQLNAFADTAIDRDARNEPILVRFDADATIASERLKRTIKEKHEYYKDMGRKDIATLYTRMQFNIEKVASLVAIGVSHSEPIIALQDFKWAVDLVSHGFKPMIDRMLDGSVGEQDDGERVYDCLCNLVRHYALHDWKSQRGDARTKGSVDQHEDKVISVGVLGAHARHSIKKVQYGTVSSFVGLAVRRFVAEGVIVEVSDDVAREKYKTRAKLYQIVTLP